MRIVSEYEEEHNHIEQDSPRMKEASGHDKRQGTTSVVPQNAMKNRGLEPLPKTKAQ